MYSFACELGKSESQQTPVIGAEHRETGQKYAIKIINKSKCNQKRMKEEIKMLQKLRHPCFVELNQVFEDSKFVYLIMPRYLKFFFFHCDNTLWLL